MQSIASITLGENNERNLVHLICHSRGDSLFISTLQSTNKCLARSICECMSGIINAMFIIKSSCGPSHDDEVVLLLLSTPK